MRPNSLYAIYKGPLTLSPPQTCVRATPHPAATVGLHSLSQVTTPESYTRLSTHAWLAERKTYPFLLYWWRREKYTHTLNTSKFEK